MTEPSIYDRLQHYMPQDDYSVVRDVAERVEHAVSQPLHAHAALLILACTMQAKTLVDSSLGLQMNSVCDAFLSDASNYSSPLTMLGWLCTHLQVESLGDSIPVEVTELSIVTESCSRRNQAARLDLFYRAMSTIVDIIHKDETDDATPAATTKPLDFDLLHQWRGGNELTTNIV